MISSSLERIPVTVVTGFLGSGKTTLINHVLSSGAFGRVAALVNDFGAVNIDAALVAEVADEVMMLQNGCVCCTINGDLEAAALRVLALDPPVDRIFVETTGLADPLPVGLTFLRTGLADATQLEAMVTVVDCANFALDLFATDASMAQIVHADIVVLNKIDLAEPEAVAAIARRVSIIKPPAQLVETTMGRLAPAAIIGQRAEFELLARGGCADGEHRDCAHSQHAGHGAGGHAETSDVLAIDGFTAHMVELPGTLSARRFQEAILAQFGSQGLFRAKGIVAFDESPQAYVFQYCGGRSDFASYAGPLSATRLVFIGRDLDREVIEAQIDACCVWEEAQAG